MSPYQLAIASFVVIFAIDLAAYSINKSDLIKASNLPMSIDTSEYALAVMATTFAIVTLVFSALFYFVISKIWLIRSFSAFTEILQFQCYMLSVELPMKITFMYMMPWWGQLFMADDVSLGLWIVFSVLSLYKFAILVVWGWPGIALIVERRLHMQRVSTRTSPATRRIGILSSQKAWDRFVLQPRPSTGALASIRRRSKDPASQPHGLPQRDCRPPVAGIPADSFLCPSAQTE